MSEVAPMYLVQVGEVERRAAERAAVDNMKEAYVSVLAPSQLGYVQAYMRGKAEELQEEVDASLSKLISAKRPAVGTSTLCITTHGPC
eukprot:jgi/Tetstr1/456358/TSEL_043093.t1